MQVQYQTLTYVHVGIASLLVLLSGLLALYMKLKITRSLWLASVRTILQLLLMGLTLEFVFKLGNFLVILALLVGMTLIAGYTAGRRAHRKYKGVGFNAISAVWISSWSMLIFGSFAIFRIENWKDPQYIVPILGMILGNSLNGICLTLDRFSEELYSKKDRLDCLLSLGASSFEAARPMLVTAIRTGTLPIINSMMVAGIVSLPGMMTGQLIAGVSPIEAVKYQIIIMFLISTSTFLGTVIVGLMGFFRLFNQSHQFKYWDLDTGQ